MNRYLIVLALFIFIAKMNTRSWTTDEAAFYTTSSARTWLILTKAIDDGIPIEDLKRAQAAPGHPLNTLDGLSTESLVAEYENLKVASYQRDLALGF